MFVENVARESGVAVDVVESLLERFWPRVYAAGEADDVEALVDVSAEFGAHFERERASRRGQKLSDEDAVAIVRRSLVRLIRSSDRIDLTAAELLVAAAVPGRGLTPRGPRRPWRGVTVRRSRPGASAPILVWHPASRGGLR